MSEVRRGRESAVVVYSRMIKLSHTIFAMPFALAAGALAARQVTPSWWQWTLILICLVTARSTAMGFNRLVDRDVDARNPRTKDREIPSGQISVADSWRFTLGTALAFVAACAALGPTTLKLAPIALAVVWGYSLTKRFTWLCHAFLGAGLALAPTGVWVALTDSYSAVPALLSAAVATWVAGFDILYACQDAEFDRAEGLFSVPASLGVSNAMRVSAGLHGLTLGLLAALPATITLGPAYFVGLAAIGAVLVWEHSLVSPTDLSRIDKAFFDLNGYVSLLFFAAVLAA